MSREIKFRAWNPTRAKWIEKFAVFPDGRIEVFMTDMPRTGEHIELMQYTGLKDKNGVEIFEGDIVIEPNFAPAVIKFGSYKSDPKWGFEDKGYGYYCENAEDGQCGLDADANTFEIVGNLYEHPNVLTNNESKETN